MCVTILELNCCCSYCTTIQLAANPVCCSWNCQLYQYEFSSGVLVANVHLHDLHDLVLRCCLFITNQKNQQRRPHAKALEPLENLYPRNGRRKLWKIFP